jgi:hypothetical protein
MLHVECAVTAQWPVTVSAQKAIVMARLRFANLTATGILGAKQTGPPIDPAHVNQALAFLAGCRPSKIPNVHSFDLRQAIGGVSVGAVIAAAVALGFIVVSWSGVVDYSPHVMIGINGRDANTTP